MSGGNQVRPSFIDTNIWLYAFIPSQDAHKAMLAKAIIGRGDIIISLQVINEVCVNLIKKAQFDEARIRQLINSFYSRYTVVSTDRIALLKASEFRGTLTLSFWDSLIISSAVLGGAEVLYTEDMSNGMVIENRLTIRNPFLP